MKKILSVILAIMMLVSIIPADALNVVAATGNTTEFAGGSGTADDPYLVETKYHLDNVRFYSSSHFKMIDNIEFSDEDFKEYGFFYNNAQGWDPIGFEDLPFSGVFDGNGCSISNLYINSSKKHQGLFGYIQNATISGLFLINANVKGGSSVGMLIGTAVLSTIKSCYVEGDLVGSSNVGGIVGNLLYDANVVGCSADGTVTGSGSYIGGICGEANPYEESKTIRDSYIQMCYNRAEVSGGGYVGGIVGYAHSSSAYDYSYTPGSYGGAGTTSIKWKSAKNIHIKNCYNIASISSTGDYCSGIVGTAIRQIFDDSYMNDNVYIENCYNTGTVTGIGSNYAPILVPRTWTWRTYDISVTNSYFLTNCAGDKNHTFGTERNNNQLRTKDAFANWDFETIWTMGGEPDYDYPELQVFVLTGELGILGNVAYLSTVEPNLSKVGKVDDTFVYEWLINNEVVSTEETYTLQASDIGKKLKLKVTGYKQYNQGTLYSDEFVVSKAIQTADVVVPSTLSVTDNKFEITTVAEQEYSIDNKNWQSSGVFENLDPNKEYTVYSRILENDLYLLGNSTQVLTITTERRPITGSINIVGNPYFGNTLTANVSSVGPDSKATYSYEWKRGNEVVDTSATYTVVKEDIGQNITLSVIGTNDYIGTLVSAAVVGIKASVLTPNAPVVENKTNNTVKLISTTGYEYSKDKINWQTSSLFTGLSPNVEYTFYQRVAETETEFASASSNGTKATTLKNTISAPEKPIIENVTNNSVILKNIAGYEYSKNGTNWQTSNVFTGLSPNTEYSFCQRIVETYTDYASAPSGYTSTVTLKNTVSAPTAPVVESATDSSVTLVAINGYEYSKDGATWQNSNIFYGLEALETYTFYQRIAETETDYASTKSAGKSFKVKFIASKPLAPVLVEVTNNKIVVETTEGYQYSIDGVSWRSQGTFTGLNPNTTYSVRCRMPENDEYYASVNSNALKVTTLKNSVNTPGAPILISNNATSITLVATTGYEYSKNGTTWQDSNVFSGLLPNTEYTFYQRVKETNTDYASEISNGLTVTTLKNTVVKPSAPTLLKATANSVTLTSKSGYEYSKDGLTWQNSNVFSGLLPNTSYKFYQRVKETNTSYASEISSGLLVVTLKNTVNAPSAPTLASKTDTVVTLNAIAGYEYSKDGVVWQSSNVFNNLTPDTSYTFYQRVAETNTCYASESSVSFTVSTYKVCEVDPTLHVFNNACDFDCNVCGETRVPQEHVYDNVCDTTCNVCNDIREVPDHVYDNNCDVSCNECDIIRDIIHDYTEATCTKPATCNVCGKTIGDVIDHTYEDVLTRATLYKNGSIVKKCSVCGYVESTTSINYVKSFALTTTSYTYSGAVRTPGVIVKDSAGKTLVKNTDYTVSYASGRKNAGTYKVTVTMKGNYTGTKTLTFKINPVSYSKCKFALTTTNYMYNKGVRTPGVIVKYGSLTLKKNVDYTVAYASGRKNVGVYKVTVKMKGNYTGSKVLTFNIKPTTKSSATILIGKTSSIGAKSNKGITYKSSNTKIATVNSKGVITAKKAGTAIITVTSNKVSQKITVKVSNPYVKVTGTNSMYIGGSVALKATTNTGIKATWSSSNKKVATVSSSGKVKGIKAGSATIYAKVKYKGKTYTGAFKVTVKTPTLKISKSALTIYVGDTYTITATATPKATVKFKSSNTGVATVSSSGKITPKKAGTAVITAYFTYGGKTYSKTCKVTVKRSGFRLVKNYIIKNGSKNSDGNYQIGMYDERSSATYYFTIAHNAKNNSLIFKYWQVGSTDVDMTFELKENQKTINITSNINLTSSTYATATYSLNVPTYYKGAGYTYHVVSHGLLNPSDYFSTVESTNDLAFSGWQLVLSSKGFSLEDVGFVNF